jgi:hypothetical protein
MTNWIDIKRIGILAPVFGIALFVILYFIATLFYPGGSQIDTNSSGFSCTHNYWCNLLNEKAINGQINDAQPIALTAMFILCTALTIFWLQFPKYLQIGNYQKLFIQISGTLAMIISLLLFTSIDHDLITNMASAFGLIATTGTLMGLYKNRWKPLFYFGLFNVGLIGANNFLYYNKNLILYLPLVQKITFMNFLIWICVMVIKMYRSYR